jgi:hypothetical protein
MHGLFPPTSKGFGGLPVYGLRRVLDAMWLPDNTVSEIGKNLQTKWKSASLSRSRNSLAAVGAAFQRTC